MIEGNEPSIDWVVEQEVAYAAMAATCHRTAHAVYLQAPALPEYREANRALRLRSCGEDPARVAAEVVEHFRSRGLPVTADVDEIAEAEGIGMALRRLGITPVQYDWLLMRLAHDSPASTPQTATVTVVPNETGSGEAAVWAETAVADDVGWPDEMLWRQVAALEARSPNCRLYLALLDGRPAGTCALFQHGGAGRIESVVTVPEFRRRGVASQLVGRAVLDSLTSGSGTTYLFSEPGGAAERLYARLGFERWRLNMFRRHAG